MHNRAHSMQHIAAGQVESRGDFCPSRLLIPPLGRHQSGTGQPQLYPGVGVDGIVYTAVAGHKAAEQLAVGRVDDPAAPQGGDIALPQVNPRLHRLQTAEIGDPPAAELLLQIIILHPQKLRPHRARRAEIEQGTEQSALFPLPRRNAPIGEIVPLGEQGADQPDPPL